MPQILQSIILFATLALLPATISADCNPFNGIGRKVTWHANNGLGYTGSKDIDICGCLEGPVNIGQCIVEYAFPDGQSVWGYMTYCNQGKTQLESGTSICLGGAAGEGWVLSA